MWLLGGWRLKDCKRVTAISSHILGKQRQDGDDGKVALTAVEDSVNHLGPHCLACGRFELLEGRLEGFVSCLVHAAD